MLLKRLYCVGSIGYDCHRLAICCVHRDNTALFPLLCPRCSRAEYINKTNDTACHTGANSCRNLCSRNGYRGNATPTADYLRAALHSAGTPATERIRERIRTRGWTDDSPVWQTANGDRAEAVTTITGVTGQSPSRRIGEADRIVLCIDIAVEAPCPASETTEAIAAQKPPRRRVVEACPQVLQAARIGLLPREGELVGEAHARRGFAEGIVGVGLRRRAGAIDDRER